MGVLKLAKDAISTPAAGIISLIADTASSKVVAVDESGNKCYVGGLAVTDYRLIRVVKYTGGNNTFTPNVGFKALYVEGCGAGAAGGGAATSSSTCSVGGGGGGGAYAAVWLTGTAATAEATFAANVGVGGSAGAAGAVGGNGGSTVFTGNSTVTNRLTAVGGTGGGVLAAGSTVVTQAGGAGGAAASCVGDLAITGGEGHAGMRGSAAIGWGGQGGGSYACPVGGRGAGVVAGGLAGSGSASGAVGVGGGGGGTTTTACAGGGGAAGFIRIWEFA